MIVFILQCAAKLTIVVIGNVQTIMPTLSVHGVMGRLLNDSIGGLTLVT